MIYWNIPGISGATVHYNNSLTHDWNVSNGTAWSIPLGAGISKSWALNGGHGWDIVFGYYNYASRPVNGPIDEVRFGLSWILPPKLPDASSNTN